MTAVKICGLTRLEDARWAAHCGADLLGFLFWPGSSRYIAPERAARITRALRAEGCRALLVGVFVGQEPDHVRSVALQCGLDLVQLHGGESPAYAEALGLPYLLARRVRSADDLTGLDAYPPWGLVLDSYDPTRPGGTGRTWRWELLEEATGLPERLLLAGGLTPDNVATAIRTAHPWGVDVASGVEAAPGIKDPERVAAFIHSVREEDRDDRG
jgi:phosphoribosylanthranilate isomerase